MSINALDEIEDFLEKIIAADVQWSTSILDLGKDEDDDSEEIYDPFSDALKGDDFTEDEEVLSYTLYEDHKSKKFDEFCEFMDREYDNEGEQALFGTIWLSDGTWLTRQDGERGAYWMHHKRPNPPKKKGR